MSILYLWNSSCMRNYRLYSLSTVISNNHSPIHMPSKSVLPNKLHFFTPIRYFSWDSFYISISTSAPVLTLQNVLCDLHNTSGLPWWAVIMLSTLGIRSLLIFPLTVHQNQVTARLANINAELKSMVPQLTKEVNIAAKMYGWHETLARRIYKKNMRNYYQKFILRDNCHPFKIVLLAFFQIPVWFCFSISLRNLTIYPIFLGIDGKSVHQQLKSEGILWFTDLTVPDMFVIPFLLATINLILIEIHALQHIGKKSTLQKIVLYTMRFIVVLVAGAAAINPASVTFYWLCSSTFGLFQNILFMTPRFRRLMRIPRIANESSTPFADIASNFRKRFLS